MPTRRVRGETGAIFEVDTSMLDETTPRESTYRASSGLPRVGEIRRVWTDPGIPLVIRFVGTALALAWLFAIMFVMLER